MDWEECRVEVNKNYEIEYKISEKIGKEYVFERKVSLVLLEKRNDREVVLRADNSHSKEDGSGYWPIHIHIPETENKHYVIGGRWSEFTKSFIEKAVEIIEVENKSDLKSAIDCIPNPASGT